MPESNDINAFPYFKKLDKTKYYPIHKSFMDRIKAILDTLNIDRKKVYVVSPTYSNAPIRDLIERIEKRKIYFHIFHRLTMDELNEVSFYCFWILKLQPFRHRDEHIFGFDKLNSRIALCLLLKTAVKYASCNNNLKVGITSEGLRNLRYAFLYHDLSKEAIMALARNLVVYK
jgi:hypothetical protein